MQQVLAADLLAYKPDALEALAEKIMALDPDTLSQKADIARQTAGAGLDFHDGRFDGDLTRLKLAPAVEEKHARCCFYLCGNFSAPRAVTRKPLKVGTLWNRRPPKFFRDRRTSRAAFSTVRNQTIPSPSNYLPSRFSR